MKIDYIKNRQDLIDRMNRLKDRPLPTLEKLNYSGQQV